MHYILSYISPCAFYSQGSNSRKRKRAGDSSSKTLDATPKRSKKVWYEVIRCNLLTIVLCSCSFKHAVLIPATSISASFAMELVTSCWYNATSEVL
jgi:hypothetical protein